ncbi:hypothetical protein H5410_055062, partial [Solanum commersonii]
GRRPSKTKTKYLEYRFSDETHEIDNEVRLDIQIIQKRGSFKYLLAIIQGSREIDDNVTHYMVVVRLIYCVVDCWLVMNPYIQKMKVVKMRIDKMDV